MSPVRKELLTTYKYSCAICGWRAIANPLFIDPEGNYVDYGLPNGGKHQQFGNEIHHIIPVSKGGNDTLENLILLCPNHHKQANMGIIPVEVLKEYWKPPMTADEYMQFRFDHASEVVADNAINISIIKDYLNNKIWESYKNREHFIRYCECNGIRYDNDYTVDDFKTEITNHWKRELMSEQDNSVKMPDGIWLAIHMDCNYCGKVKPRS